MPSGIPADRGVPPETSSVRLPTLTLQVEPRVAAGALVRFRLVVQNAGAERLTLYLRGRTPTFDVIVARDGAVVWQRLADEFIPAIIQARTLDPGERLVLETTWTAPSERGRYDTHALLLTDEGSPRRSNGTSFVVE